MSVYSGYIYLLPQTSANATVKLNLTIGGKAFTNKSVTLSGLTLTANNTYYTNVSFTTTEGYIIGEHCGLMETYTKVATSIFFTAAQKNMKLEQKAALSLYVTIPTRIPTSQLLPQHGTMPTTPAGSSQTQQINGGCLH